MSSYRCALETILVNFITLNWTYDPIKSASQLIIGHITAFPFLGTYLPLPATASAIDLAIDAFSATINTFAFLSYKLFI
jgi:hypothetical protein